MSKCVSGDKRKGSSFPLTDRAGVEALYWLKMYRHLHSSTSLLGSWEVLREHQVLIYKLTCKIEGEINTYTGPMQKHLQGLLAKIKTVQFGIALNVAAHNILKENYGI